MNLVDKVSIVWCLQKQFIYSFLIMSNKLTKRFSIIVTKSWNSRTNCCLVYLSVHMCDAEKKVGVWYIFSILPLGSWAHMKSRRVLITDHSFSHFGRVKTLAVFIRRCLFLPTSSPFPQKESAAEQSSDCVRWSTVLNRGRGLVWNFSHLLEVW